ncbi:MAG: hypothetical protein H0U46_03145 [Actinobacteria bacterium]|nr:hypothetical protein [Actinomycetota bacterium]
MLYPREGTRTRQRKLRRDVRSDLGTSSDPAPSLRALLSAARALGAMLDNESGGRFGISIHDFDGHTVTEHTADIPVGIAIGLLVNAERWERERNERLSASADERHVGWDGRSEPIAR